MKVVPDGKMSREIPVDFSVPQGTVLSTLLFLCHMHDLPTSVKSLKSVCLQTIAYYIGQYMHLMTILCSRMI